MQGRHLTQCLAHNKHYKVVLIPSSIPYVSYFIKDWIKETFQHDDIEVIRDLWLH